VILWKSKSSSATSEALIETVWRAGPGGPFLVIAVLALLSLPAQGAVPGLRHTAVLLMDCRPCVFSPEG
jgi:hypothetical protein